MVILLIILVNGVHIVHVQVDDELAGPDGVRLIWHVESAWVAILLLIGKR